MNNKKKAVNSSVKPADDGKEKAANHSKKRPRGCIFVSETVHNWADFEKRLEQRKG